MRKLFAALGEAIQSGRGAVIVTVIASSGSTPRSTGACMLVTEEGRVRGTIGGGAVEYRSEQLAKEVLRAKSTCVEHYRLHPNEVQDLGMICGGDVYVYFRYVPAGDMDTIALADAVAQMYRRGEQCWLIHEITSGREGAMGLYGKKSGLHGADIPAELIDRLKDKAGQLELGERSFYCEPLILAGVVYIFGGGHVAQALVPMLIAVQFRCVVLEDREEFCRRELFAGVEETILIDNSRISDFVSIGADDYVVVMTRGHKDDQIVQAQMLHTPARYIGVIGSRRKAAGVFANLREMGHTQEELARITTPIGLDIGAETPEEIAVSITAQLILTRVQRNV